MCKMNNSLNKLLDEDIAERKAMLVLASILLTAGYVKDSLFKEVPRLKLLNNVEQCELNNIISLFLFFHASKSFWERIIPDSEDAVLFDKTLLRKFAQLFNLNPVTFLKEMGGYIKRIGAEGEIQFVGSKICDAFNIQSGIALAEISICSGTHIPLLIECCADVWRMDNQNACSWKMMGESVGSLEIIEKCLNDAWAKLYVEKSEKTEAQPKGIAWWKIGVIIGVIVVSLWILCNFDKLLH